MMKYLLLSLLLLTGVGCNSTEEPVDDDPPVPKARILFVNAFLDAPPVQFQVQRLNGSPLASIVPQYLSFSQISRYQRVEAGPSEVRALDSISREFILRREIDLPEGETFSFYLYPDTQGDTAGFLLREDLTSDTTGRAKARPINLLSGVDRLRYTLSRDDDTLIVDQVPFAVAPPDFQPLFDTTGSILVNLRVDILEAGTPEDLLFTGDVALVHGSYYSIVAMGTRTSPQIIVIPHSNL